MQVIVRLKSATGIQEFMEFASTNRFRVAVQKNLEYLVSMVYGVLDPMSVKHTLESITSHPSVLDATIAPVRPSSSCFSTNDF